jgi:hypothetical protein
MFLVLAVAIQSAPATFSSYTEGTRWDFVVSRDDIERSPRWADSDDSPPLAPRPAMRSARLMLAGLVPNADQWRTGSVNLQQVLFADTWIYIVEFRQPSKSPAGGVVTPMRVVVLMNGRAIIPVKSQWPRPQ